MGQMVFVLTAKLEGNNGYGPVAVTTSEHAANEWIRAGNDHDWVPLELDDLSTTGMADKQVTNFKPVPAPKRVEQQNTQLEQMKQQVQKLQGIITELTKRLRGKRGAIHQDTLIEAFYRGKAQSILNEYLMERGDQDPKIYDFLRWVNDKFKETDIHRFNIMQSVLFRKYQEMFGNK